MPTKEQEAIWQAEANRAAEEAIQAEENGEKKIYSEKASEEQNKDTAGPTNEAKDKARDFRYPLTLSDNYPARITFQVIKIEGENIFDATGITKVIKKGKEILESLTGNQDKSQETESVADASVERGEKKKIIEDSRKKEKSIVSYENNVGGKPLGKVTLPLQKALRYDDGASYNQGDLGILGGAGEAALTGTNPFEGVTKNGQLKKTAGALAAQLLAKNAGALVGGAAGSIGGPAGAVLGGIAGSALGGDDAGNAVSSATRIAGAPNSRTLFEKVRTRTFAFDFKMIANSEEEAIMIKNIVKMFRQELYPEKIPIGSTGVPLAYKFPNVFEITVKNRQQYNPGFKIQRCYLTDVATAFNETSNSLFESGHFVEVSLSLKFTEIVALDKGKIRNDY